MSTCTQSIVQLQPHSILSKVLDKKEPHIKAPALSNPSSAAKVITSDKNRKQLMEKEEKKLAEKELAKAEREKKCQEKEKEKERKEKEKQNKKIEQQQKRIEQVIEQHREKMKALNQNGQKSKSESYMQSNLLNQNQSKQ